MILLDGYAIDMAKTEEHVLDSEATTYPIEDGSDVTDHVRLLPIQVTVEGIVSDTPIGDMVLIRQAELPILAFSDPTTATVVTATRHSEAALAKLKSIRAARRPITIVTALQTYKNMVMTSLSIPLSRETGKALRFNATFQQVEIVTNNRTTTRTATPGTSKKKDLGDRPALALEKRRVIWHIGKPPGGPKTGASVVLTYDPTVKEFYRPDGTTGALRPLTLDELSAANKDFARDNAPIVGTYDTSASDAFRPKAPTKAPVTDPSKLTAHKSSLSEPNRNLPEGLDLNRFSQKPTPTLGGKK